MCPTGAGLAVPRSQIVLQEREIALQAREILLRVREILLQLAHIALRFGEVVLRAAQIVSPRLEMLPLGGIARALRAIAAPICTQVSIEQLQRVHALTHPGASLHFKPVENPLAHGLRVSAGTAQAAAPDAAQEIEGMLEDDVEDDDA
jgi:hypothetical protein